MEWAFLTLAVFMVLIGIEFLKRIVIGLREGHIPELDSSLKLQRSVFRNRSPFSFWFNLIVQTFYALICLSPIVALIYWLLH